LISSSIRWREDQGERAIGIVLSGTGSDGSQGIEAIRAAGGIVIAQLPESAAYDGMPRSAIATGMVDATCRPKRCPPSCSVTTQTHEPPALCSLNQERSELHRSAQKDFSLLYNLTRQDFSSYKQSTILRQIERRMKVNFLTNLNQYVQLSTRKARGGPASF
jgi:two-component system, chemotaxis family, CheB/CheR fusion protein